MYIAVWESLSPSPLALQKEYLLFAVLCVRYVALRSGSVSQTTMLLRLSRPYSYDPRPISKKHTKSDILMCRRVFSKCKKETETGNLTFWNRMLEKTKLCEQSLIVESRKMLLRG